MSCFVHNPKIFHNDSIKMYVCEEVYRNKNNIFTMRHVPVWVEAILHERGTTFPETND